MPLPESARRFPRSGIATPHYLASATGLATLAQGGNAVDAIVAANLALGVVAPYFCGYGGDVFAIVWDGSAHGYVGSGHSAATASVDALRGEGLEHMPYFGGHSVTVPGGPRGWFDLLERWGTKSFGELSEAAVGYARDGFEPTVRGHDMITQSSIFYPPEFEWPAMYDGATVGGRLRQPALAELIERLAAGGPDAYYRGEVAETIAATIQQRGGLITADDIAAHRGEWVDPIRAGFRDVEILELPPPTQGVTALEMLRIVDGIELPPDGPERQHLLIEAAKLAFADRDTYVSDPRHMRVDPAAILADDWIAARRARIDPSRASSPEPYRAPTGGTAYLCAADADGLLVSLIQSNFLGFGSGIHVDRFGINLNNRGSSFNLTEGHANAIAPTKRPMHTLIPALGLRDGDPWLVFGSMGGDAQPLIHLQLLTRILDDHTELQAALAAPRFNVDAGRWRVKTEWHMPAETVAGLEAFGHRVESIGPLDVGVGHAHAIELGPEGGYAVATDPRAEGAALGL
jgi:gamma-glutamyltranspeptidase/glutathione hydrolase